MDREHEHDPEPLIAWAFAGDEAEENLIRARLNGCSECASRAARWRHAVRSLNIAEPVEPPGELRGRILAQARASIRRTTPVPVQTLAYAGQVTAMDELLARLSPPDWGASVPGGRDIRGLIAHLSGNDALVTIGMRPAVTTTSQDVREAWRDGAAALLEEVRPRGAGQLDLPVRMAGRRPSTRPLRDGLIQRTFETWIHADDVRTAVGLPSSPPPPAHIGLIADLGARLLPIALSALGVRRAGRLLLLRLTGAGGGGWNIPLDTGVVTGEPISQITMDATEFCRLIAGRTVADGGYLVEGDQVVARKVLHAATTLGCE